MMVIFVSQCEKKALNRTRQVLDAFADRIGERTWRTIITEDGLLAVKKLLRKTATKNTSVACHWLRSRHRSDLVWVVGNKKKFNQQGIVAVNQTQKSILYNDSQNEWTYLPLMKSIVAIAALLHDWGKANAFFQKKITQPGNLGDPLRHEWISCLLFQAFVFQSGSDSTTDVPWLNALINQSVFEKDITAYVIQQSDYAKALEKLPPIAQLVAWLIVSHHRLPDIKDQNKDKERIKRKEYSGDAYYSVDKLFAQITAQWGYQNLSEDYDKQLKHCFTFKQGLLSNSIEWKAQLKKWAALLLNEQQKANQVIQDGSWRVLLHHARLSLMLGDHYYSSCPASQNWHTSVELYANTDQSHQLKQKLDEHLVHVSKNALKVIRSLRRFKEEMAYVEDVYQLKQKSKGPYIWQDNAVTKIRQFYETNAVASDKANMGCFIVNMASTGCGKTIANAKIMQALSVDGNALRYILALGLRTLTLQTGTAYRQALNLDGNDMAVLVGSSVIKELYEAYQTNNELLQTESSYGSESAEKLFDEDLDYESLPTAEFLDGILTKEKDKAFLYKPVLVCTIDHIIRATEVVRGGKYILPGLRLLSSDLVIDEVDDFDGKDLVAIARLIHLAGMLGRKVMISSATIPPALAEGFFHSYQEGWTLYCHFHHIKPQISAMWVDEFQSKIDWIALDNSTETYQKMHRQFIDDRVKNLKKQTAKRKAYVVDCDVLKDTSASMEKREEITKSYFSIIQAQILGLHQQHHFTDDVSGKRISIGVIRMANVTPCVALSEYLIQMQWGESVTPKIMAYHSKQVLILRALQERHLDKVLNRKVEEAAQQYFLEDEHIRDLIQQVKTPDVIFILVATPVEEVGRDHDFDWAVIEPSSYRSIIQLAGRVRRHRNGGVSAPNIAIMQYNLKGLWTKESQPVFINPGFENASNMLKTHDMRQLLDTKLLAKSVNAIPRIKPATVLKPNYKIADLEHYIIGQYLTNYGEKGPAYLESWLKEIWFLTALPQKLNGFREGAQTYQLYWVVKQGEMRFEVKNLSGEYIELHKNQYSIEIASDNMPLSSSMWLERNYIQALSDMIFDEELKYDNNTLTKVSRRYGELAVPAYDIDKKLIYSDQFGLVRRDNG